MEGKIREAWEQFDIDKKEICRLLGQESPATSDDMPARGRLQIDDLVATVEEKPHLTRNRIALEQDLGSVQHGALQVMETPFAAGRDVTFSGSAWCYGGNAEYIRRLLSQGLGFLLHLGSGRSIGLGRLTAVEVKHVSSVSAQASPELGSASMLKLVLQPQGPLCVARHKMDDNLFESEDFIPGNMIAGALVETWAAQLDLPAGSFVTACADKDPARSLLAKHFNNLRFRHAFPAPVDMERPRAISLSWVEYGKKNYDMAAQPTPKLLPNQYNETVAPAFLIDWKDFSTANAACGRFSPARELRVRTAIDSSKRTAHRNSSVTGGGKLFAWELLHPEVDDDGHTALGWHGVVDLAAVPEADRTAVAAQLAGLVADLGFVSKTKAHCPATISAAESIVPAGLQNGSPLYLVLQTPALLADPRFQSLPDVPTHGALSAAAMTALYRAAWSELSEESLELTHHFSRQKLAGGPYMARRYQKNKPYNPWLLTTEGSFFALTVKDAAKATDRLTAWLQTGLPLPRWAIGQWGDSWAKNPFLPQNGFGEVAVHQAHSDFSFPHS